MQHLYRKRAPKHSAFSGVSIGAITVVVLTSVLGRTAESGEGSQQDETRREMRRLQDIWSGWSGRVKSLSIKGYQFFGDCDAQSKAFLRRDLTRFVYESIVPALSGGATDLESLKRLTDTIFSAQPVPGAGPRPIGDWRPYEFFESGGKRRTDLKLLGTISRVRKDSIEQQYDSGARQVSLFPSESNIVMERIADFVYTSTPLRDDIAWSLKRGNGRLRLESGASVLECDETTGFIEHRVERARDDWYLRERFQSIPIATSANVPIGQFIADATYWPGGDAETAPVHWLHMYYIESISVNEPVDDSVFALAVPADTNIIKFPSADNNPPIAQGEPRPAMHKITDAVADAGKFAESPDFGVPSNARPVLPTDLRGAGWTSKQVALIGINAFLLVSLLFWARRRVARRSI